MAKRARFVFFAAVAAASLIFLLERSFLPGRPTETPSKTDFKLVEKVIGLIRNHYFEEPQPFETMEGAFRGLVNSLDPLSSYLDKKNALKYQLQREGRLKETGLILFKEKYGYYPQVLAIIENSPADEKEFEIGDLIINIDGKSSRSMSMLEANLSLMDSQGNFVHLEFIRGRNTQELTIKREQLFDEPFSFSFQEKTSGILKIHHIYPPCGDKVMEKILPRLKRQKKPLILDLRNCYRGDLAEAIHLANLFLKADDVAYIDKRGGAKEKLSLREEPGFENLPLIIWINQATMGPAEALAAILGEFRKSKILGSPSPGFAAEIRYFALEDGSALLLNSGIFVLKHGKKMWKKGIIPDVAIKGRKKSTDAYWKETLKLLSKM